MVTSKWETQVMWIDFNENGLVLRHRHRTRDGALAVHGTDSRRHLFLEMGVCWVYTYIVFEPIEYFKITNGQAKHGYASLLGVSRR